MRSSFRDRLSGRFVFVLSALLTTGLAAAQVSVVPQAGISERPARVLALTGARLVIKPGHVIERGSLILRDGVIEAVGSNVRIPAGASTIDLAGRTVFPGFIDAATDYLQPDERAPSAPDGRRGVGFKPAPQAGARYWTSFIRPEREVAQSLTPNPAQARKLRALGFTSVLSVPRHGVLRGQSAVLSTDDADRLNGVLLVPQATQVAAFETSTTGEYPRSLMGAVALLRQALYDADWQREQLQWQQRHPGGERGEANLALTALQPLLSHRQSLLFVAHDELDYARVASLKEEFGVDMLVQGTGYEYRQIAQLRKAGTPVILPLDFPEAPAVEDPEAALDVSLQELEHWEWAPFNPRVVSEAGIAFALTADGLSKPETQFWQNLRKAVRSGLSEEAALDAITRQPAKMLGVADRLGTLEAGHLANLVVADQALFRDDDARIHEVWVDGHRHLLTGPNAGVDVAGQWSLHWRGANGPAQLQIEGTRNLTAQVGQVRFPVTVSDREIRLYPPGQLLGLPDERISLTASVDGQSLQGHVLRQGRDAIRFSGQRQSAPQPSTSQLSVPALPGKLRFPAGEYGRDGLPQQQRVLVRGATIWTQTAQGVIEDADLLIDHGKIAAVGQHLTAPAGAVEVDGKGMHVTPGLIDAHSHIAISRGINEGSQSVVSEVRVSDVLDPTDISIHRQLAGGVTSSLLLHGSSNTIGGQSQVIKLRWGADAAGLVFQGADPTIKFALGENVKQSNWGFVTGRFPQTRLGVQELLRDQFAAARDYVDKRKAKGLPPQRRNLRLEALAEVVSKQRTVHIHSYRQDELLGFAALAREYGIVPVFQHVLEGYKVADELAKLGAGASTFSDRWGFKVEANDGNAYNPAMLVRRGVLTSINSDSAELARRLNTEAAKAVKYGGLSPTQALDLVTRSPAKQLGVESRVGSLEAGKDADFVIWSASPLSTQAIPQQTWVDGRRYFDRQADLAEQRDIEQQRTRLIQKALPERVKALGGRGAGEGNDAPSVPARGRGQPSQEGPELQHLALYHDGTIIHVCEEEY